MGKKKGERRKEKYAGALMVRINVFFFPLSPFCFFRKQVDEVQVDKMVTEINEFSPAWYY